MNGFNTINKKYITSAVWRAWSRLWWPRRGRWRWSRVAGPAWCRHYSCPPESWPPADATRSVRPAPSPRRARCRSRPGPPRRRCPPPPRPSSASTWASSWSWPGSRWPPSHCQPFLSLLYNNSTTTEIYMGWFLFVHKDMNRNEAYT